MKGFLIGLGIFGFIVFLIGSSLVGSYNGLINLRESATEQQSEIENAMQRRADLVPQLVGATKGAMSQERAVFDDISKAHAAFSNAPSGTVEKMQAGDALSTAIRGYMVIAQQYPTLMSLSIIKDLGTTIEGTENRISIARRRYNEDVKSYNQRVQSFPVVLYAGALGFEKMSFFQAEEGAKTVPTVNLDFENK